ncbi:hypothetical protein RB25_03030 [Herbaspirillum rubrisubalbicans]|uniref:Uncharacterized protein n=1 Tax=Herbaspirillum rubrisubalbicans TaxID=80842 RepID=A0ABX9C321_9BURK|nr:MULTISPECIES: hypothetical protein [Herbaspirillum]MCP1573903.1 Na+/melibiose symporter-like transporter [Herbaspirillum rubrisubalbicans]RAM64713.1 hypothetical protein RB24_11000 [Herbaspirillum rubrisubalbicans]RAN50118.1 hypothetical protein RB25_03030 [Herbaspirillum rubrisubalbicans]
MSLIVALTEMLGGMLAEYSIQKKWSKVKIFFVTSAIFFATSLLNLLVFEHGSGVLLAISGSAILGVSLGIFFVLTIYIHEKTKK